MITMSEQEAVVREYNVRTSDCKSGISYYFFKKIFIYFWLCRVLVATQRTFVEEVCRLLSCGGSQAPEHAASAFGGTPPQ